MAEFRPGLKWGFYISSYWPLFILLAFKHWKYAIEIPDRAYIPRIFVGINEPFLSYFWIIMSSFAILPVLAIRVREVREPDAIEVVSYQDGGSILSTYILVYIFPFVVLDYSTIANWIAFVTFFLVIGLVQINSNQLFVNPTFLLLGYKTYEVDDGDRKIILLSKDKISRHHETISAVELSDDVYLSKTNQEIG